MIIILCSLSNNFKSLLNKFRLVCLKISYKNSYNTFDNENLNFMFNISSHLKLEIFSSEYEKYDDSISF